MSIFGNPDLFAQFENSPDNESDEDYDWEELHRYQEENAKLKIENEELRKTLRILIQPRNVAVQEPDKDGPIAQLLLFNNAIARHERESIEEFLRRYFSRNKAAGGVFAKPQNNALQCPKAHCLGSQNDSIEVDKAFVVTNSIQFYNNHFCVDHLGDPVQKNQKLVLKAPQYHRICDVLNGEEPLEEKKDMKATRTCFNCGQTDHQLKDCPTPKNYKAINQRKQKFMSQVTSSPQAGTVRYHDEDDACESRFSKFKAGSISQALRDALGIRDNELPPYIYQMRMLGYPPGHLEEAKIVGSGLSFFKDKDGGREEDVGSDTGPIDIDMFITFPGFNVTPESHVIDKSIDLGYPPMDARHSMHVMVSYHQHRNSLLQKRKAEQEEKEEQSRKRHRPNHVTHVRNDDVREVDMETSDTEADAGKDADLTVEGAPEHKPDNEVNKSTDVIAVDMETSLCENPCPEEGSGATPEESQDDVIEDGEVVSSASSYDVVIEEQALVDGMELRELDEEELQLRREEILRQLECADVDNSSSDVENIDEVAINETTLADSSPLSSPQLPDEDLGVTSENPIGKEIMSGSPHRSPNTSIVESSQTIDDSAPKYSLQPKTDVTSPESSPQQRNIESTKSSPQISSVIFEPLSRNNDENNLGLLQNTNELNPESSQNTDVVSPQFLAQKTDRISQSPNSNKFSCENIDESFAESPPQKADIISPESPPQTTTSCSPKYPLQYTNVISCQSPQKSNINSDKSSPKNCPDSPQMFSEISLKCSSHEIKEFSESSLRKSPGSSPEPSGPPSTFVDPETISPEEHEKLLADPDQVATPRARESSCDPPDSIVDSSQQLPHRSKFAQNITQFEGYFKETTGSSGVFSKLKNLLKSSPRNRGKNT